MPRWLYTEVSYNDNSKTWQEKAAGQAGKVTDPRYWLSEICETLGNQSAWELVTVFFEQHMNSWHILFKRTA